MTKEERAALREAAQAVLDTQGHDPEVHAYTRMMSGIHPAAVLALLDAVDEGDALQRTFELRWEADRRAIKRWQAAHPGKELTWPDHADLMVWLLDECERMREVVMGLLEIEGWDRTHPRYVAARAALEPRA